MRSQSWLGVVGASVAAVVGGLVLWGRVRSVDVPQPYSWGDAVVVVCPGPEVDPAALVEAVSWWVDLGHRVSVGSASCDVTIDVDVALEDHGLTRCTSTTDGQQVACQAWVRRGAAALVIAHELGHALGYQHPDGAPTGHMMHRSSPGWDARGLRVTP